MNSPSTLVMAVGLVFVVGLVLNGQLIVAQKAQELSRYRAYALESSVATVATAHWPAYRLARDRGQHATRAPGENPGTAVASALREPRQRVR